MRLSKVLHRAALETGYKRARYKDIKRSLGQVPGEETVELPVSVDPEPTTADNWTEHDTLQYLRQTKYLAGQFVSLLDRMRLQTPANEQLASLRIEDYDLRGPHRLPGFPGTIDPEELRRYVAELTNYTYIDDRQRLSDPIGLVSRLVGDVLRPYNELTGASLTTAAYNLGIGYFCRVNDVGMANQLMRYMRDSVSTQPDRTTYHLFLQQQARFINSNPYPCQNTGGAHPLLMSLATLKEMHRADISATPLTWNLTLKLMPMGFGKSFILEEMIRRDIKPDGHSSAMCLELIAAQNLDSAIDYALGLGKDMPPEVLNMLVSRLLVAKEKGHANVSKAMKLLSYGFHELGVKPSTTALNACLKGLMGRGRVDWQLGLLGGFKQLGVDPDAYTWEYLLGGCVRMVRKTKHALAGTILSRAQETGVLTRRSRIIGRRLGRISPLRDAGPERFDALVADLSWTEYLKGPPVYASSPESVQNAASLIGFNGPATGAEEWPLTEIRLGGVPRTDSVEAQEELLEDLKDPRASLRRKLLALTASMA